MRILVVGSCGKKKLTTCEYVPQCSDLQSKQDRQRWQKKLDSCLVQARDMYTGNQNKELVKGVDLLRKIPQTEVVLKIVSAGYGLLDEHERIPPYECSFSGMHKAQIIARAKVLGIDTDFYKIYEKGFDIVYLALGTDYYLSLGEDWIEAVPCTVVGFSRILSGKQVVRLPSGSDIVHAIATRGYKIHGIAGFKGDLLRILANHALTCENSYHEICEWTDPFYIRNLVYRLSGLSSEPK